MKKNKAWIEYQNKLAEQRQEKLNEKYKDQPPAKMNRETKRQYIRHYTKMGVPREEIERIIMMRSFDFKENFGVNMAEIEIKMREGLLPPNTLKVIEEAQSINN